uniref:PRELI domain-containing protein 2 n=2 Tax=Cacopsylla melanoneura TaxID=428564 RepID=A0A8D8M9M2_9HEMI
MKLNRKWTSRFYEHYQDTRNNQSIIMVLTVSVTHIFQLPIEEVVKIYFKHHPQFRTLDGELQSVQQIEHTYNEEDGISCIKSNLTYSNFIPKILRKNPKLEEPDLVMEEECWIDMVENHYWVRLRNITWNDSVSILRTTAFTPDSQNPKWTRYECDGAVEFQNWGWVGQGIEIFMRNKDKKIILQNIELLNEKIEEHKMKNNES